MTMPHERLNALHFARRFLLDLLDPSKTPKVPREIRRRASAALKHFPFDFELDALKNHKLFKDPL